MRSARLHGDLKSTRHPAGFALPGRGNCQRSSGGRARLPDGLYAAFQSKRTGNTVALRAEVVPHQSRSFLNCDIGGIAATRKYCLARKCQAFA